MKKLIKHFFQVNSLYGFFGLRSSKFSKTIILQESSLLKRHSKDLREGKCIPTLLGVVDRGENKQPDLLYLCDVDNSKAKDRNCHHLASCILGESKKLYLTKLLFLLRYFRSESVELAYCDTGKF